MALYLVRRTIFLVSLVSLDTDAYNKDTFCGSLDTEPESWFWFADPYILYRSHPSLQVFHRSYFTIKALRRPDADVSGSKPAAAAAVPSEGEEGPLGRRRHHGDGAQPLHSGQERRGGFQI